MAITVINQYRYVLTIVVTLFPERCTIMLSQITMRVSLQLNDHGLSLTNMIITPQYNTHTHRHITYLSKTVSLHSTKRNNEETSGNYSMTAFLYGLIFDRDRDTALGVARTKVAIHPNKIYGGWRWGVEKDIGKCKVDLV